jgi:RHH-type proline utilization regulon transcriptional repressor/proline dehydrogenase/delta 1-pyrroline-5-carboxylate dehydrogenase
MGRTIDEALKRGQRNVRKGEAASHSFDMLGEGARTGADARRYFESYANAIGEVGKAKTGASPETADGISVKLSALHPAYRAVQGERVHRELYPMVVELAKLAANQSINFTLDAEEADRLVLSLGLLERLAREPALAGWTGLGLAVVKKIADDHGGRIEISNRMIGTSVLGAQVSLSLGCVANVKHLENTISGPA